MTPRIPAVALALAFVLAAALNPARAEVIWRGDFSTGDLSQWPGRETVDAGSRLKVLGDMGGEGPALRALVKYGDDPINSSGNRNELFWDQDDVRDGTERAYRWRTYWPEDYGKADAWQLFTQWHQFDGGGSPPVAFLVWGDEVRLGDNVGNVLWRTPLERGRWHDFVLHVRWSADSSKGFLELWYDGRIALPLTHRATMFKGQGVYLKQGLYRSDTVKFDQAVYHRGMVVGTTVDDVWPPTVVNAIAPPQPSGTVVTSDGNGGVTSGSTTGSGSSGASEQTLPGEAGTLKVRAGCSAVEVGSLGLAALALLVRRRRRSAPTRE